ncbi:aminoglycoside phosphotransferase family protein [Tolypothrix sp. FACHB-123]|uniref:phosphotransferase n=1 Tax=Tolypothrix sp. FACHB-123 TaxID=2692868 RepID=UPI0016867E0F|nr:aminoglycoside phosphotransferase family protein [Tolypothrix sp. FACHB-123]MBD2353141.1 aminoglycoside phosphotransferase family protein [Tolypothrix sp. FACHB-123]
MSSQNANCTTITARARAVAAAVSVASAYGIKVESPYVLNNAYSLRVYLHPAPIVARVSTLTPVLRSPIESWLEREISVAEFLAARGAPVIAPSDRLRAIPHQHDGLLMSFWQYIPPVSDSLPEPQIIGRMLAELHALLQDYPGDLPLLVPPLNDIPRGLERLKQAGDILTTSDLTLLQETYERLLPQLTSDHTQPLHGDANALNLVPTAQGWLWNDFEDTCRGHIAWDLINLDEEGRAAYPHAPDSTVLEPYTKMRQLHAIVWVYALLPEFPNWSEHAKAMLNHLRDTQAISQ